jgi:hypothetical protein
MTISIQGANPAVLATLDPLAGQAGVLAGTQAGASPGASADAPGGSSAIIDLSGLAAAAPDGPSVGAATSASIADAALAAGALVEGVLAQMRQDAVSASDPSLGGDARAALSAGFQGGLGQIQAALNAAGVGGVNLIDGSSVGQGPDGLPAFDFSLGGPAIGVPASASLSDPAAAASLADQLGAALDNVGQALGQIAAQSDATGIEGTFAGMSGAGFDPGLDADGARLAALQVQQLLSASSGPIGNQAPQAILALFR